MNRDDIIQWAREAARQPERGYAPDEVEFLEALASLVASATRRRYQAEVERWQAEAVTAEKWRGIALTKAGIDRAVAEALRQEGAAAEREACASIVENADTPDCGGWTAIGIADAIRARKDSA